MSDVRKLEELVKEVEASGLNYKKVAILHIQKDEIILAETVADLVIGTVLTVLNPLRLVVLRGLDETGNIRVNYMLGDWDLLTNGGPSGENNEMHVIPYAGYYVSKQSIETQMEIVSRYLGYVENMKKVRAENAGIVLPKAGRVPGTIGAHMR